MKLLFDKDSLEKEEINSWYALQRWASKNSADPRAKKWSKLVKSLSLDSAFLKEFAMIIEQGNELAHTPAADDMESAKAALQRVSFSVGPHQRCLNVVTLWSHMEKN